MVGTADRRSGPLGLGAAGEGGGGEGRGGPGLAWVPGGNGLQVPSGPDYWSPVQLLPAQTGSRRVSEHPVRGLLDEGGPCTPRDAAASQPPSTLFSRLSRGAERTWNWGASESVTSETRMTSGKAPLSAPARCLDKGTATEPGPHGPLPETGPAEEVARMVLLAGDMFIAVLATV